MCNVTKIINLLKLPPNGPLPVSLIPLQLVQKQQKQKKLQIICQRTYFSKGASVQCNVVCWI